MKGEKTGGVVIFCLRSILFKIYVDQMAYLESNSKFSQSTFGLSGLLIVSIGISDTQSCMPISVTVVSLNNQSLLL